jgi:putative flavoprotein involved in K+ transport
MVEAGVGDVVEAEVVVVGAGQAGLAASYYLAQSGIDHVVLERGTIGESWRSQRWDSFRLNTPNWSNALPGAAFLAGTPDAFAHADDLLSFFEGYARSFALPVRANCEVTSLNRRPGGDYELVTLEGPLIGRSVILATGSMSRPRIPVMARHLPGDIVSLSAGTYRSPESLPEGSVLVVGSGQSGCQIAEDLLRSGRRVYLSASRVARAPRTHRGRDIFEWMRDTGALEIRLDELDDPSVQHATQAQVSGTDGGHTVSLQSLARDGATLLGRVLAVRGGTLELGDDLRECIDFADEQAAKIRKDIDAFIEHEGIDAPEAEPDPGEPPLPDLGGSDGWRSLDLHGAGITSVVWCTGFDADWGWVKIDVFDDRGRPRHRGGVTESPGLYFLGFPWLSKRKSGILYGVGEDAARIVRHIEREGR